MNHKSLDIMANEVVNFLTETVSKSKCYFRFVVVYISTHITNTEEGLQVIFIPIFYDSLHNQYRIKPLKTFKSGLMT